MATIEEEIVAYELLRDELEESYRGRWVLIHDGSLIGTFASFHEAAAVAASRFGRGPYLIRRVGEGPIRLSSSVMHRIQ